jgi:hypothetical protein
VALAEPVNLALTSGEDPAEHEFAHTLRAGLRVGQSQRGSPRAPKDLPLFYGRTSATSSSDSLCGLVSTLSGCSSVERESVRVMTTNRSGSATGEGTRWPVSESSLGKHERRSTSPDGALGPPLTCVKMPQESTDTS